MDGVAVRPPRVPDRLQESSRHHSALGVHFIGNARPQRTITEQQVVARVAIEEAGGRPFVLSLASDEEEPDRSEAETAG